MARYVALLNWTEQGIRGFRDSPKRSNDFSSLVESLGGTVREMLWTVGQYDLVVIVDFDDEEAAVAAVLRVNSAGNIRSCTMRAFTAEEMTQIVRKAG
jgi:uncharacterized protein with GYD domain